MKNEKIRSPFGELVHTLRKQRGWNQTRLALEATPPAGSSDNQRGITDRTVRAIEHRAVDARGWTIPRQDTVAGLAAAFGLAEGSAARAAFLQAAARTRQAIGRPVRGTSTHVAGQGFVGAGREPHLARLTGAIDEMVAGRPQAVFLTAEAGSGKTWLIAEACRQAVARHEDLVVVWGNCQPGPRITDPFQPFRQILRLMVGDTRSTSPPHLIGDANLARIRTRIPAALAALDEVGRELLHRLLPLDVLSNATIVEMDEPRVNRLVARLVDQPILHQVDDPGDSMRRVLDSYAHEGPVVLVLEDLHAGDGPTIRLLSSLLLTLHPGHAPIVVLASFRPSAVTGGLGEGTPPLADLIPQLAPSSIVDLSTSLTEAAGELFITALAAEMAVELDSDEVKRIRQQTLGLPVFVEGMLRLYREARPDPAASATAPHASRSAVFDAELDLLSPTARRALLAASVQGTSFSLIILSTVLDIPVDHLAVLLDDTPFRRMGLLQPAGVSTLDGREVNEFQFSHVLLRNHLYDGCLTDLERAHWHLRTAEALTRVGEQTGRDFRADIAFHLEQGGEPVAAASAWLQVANDLIEHSQFDRAEAMLTRVRDQNLRRLAPALEAEALLGLGHCARGLDRPADARRWLEVGLDLARRRHLPALEARMLSQLGMIAYDAGQVKRGAELLRSAIGINEATGDRAEAVRSLARLSHNLHGLGLYEDAMREAQRGLDLARMLQDDHLVCAASIALANCWLDLGCYEAARDLYESTLDVCDRLGDVHRSNICLINISLCWIEQHRWDDAARALAPLRERGRTMVPRFVGVVEFQAGLIAEGVGNWSLAQRHYLASMEIRRRNGQSALLMDALAGTLRVATALNDTSELRRLLADVDARVGEHGLDGIEHAGRVCLAMIKGALVVDDVSLAVRYAEAGMAFLTQRAEALTDARDRHSYLDVVPSHHRLRMSATMLLAETTSGRLISMASD
jgi:tetratricopeptide (TPR) repeat protein